jgi:hypothetical protein
MVATKSCCRSPNTSAFQPASIRIALIKTVQNQHEHKIGRIVMIVGMCCFLDPEPFGPLHLSPHVIHTILRFFPQPDSLHSQILRKAGQKKAEPRERFSSDSGRKSSKCSQTLRFSPSLCGKRFSPLPPHNVRRESAVTAWWKEFAPFNSM